MEADSTLKDQVYDFKGALKWQEIALRGLLRKGWRPVCAHAIKLNLINLLPPRDPQERLIFEFREQMTD